MISIKDENSKNRRIVLVIGLPILFIVVGLAILYLKINNIIKLDCFIYKNFGISCPACGITRLLNALIHGNIYQAFRYNPFIFLSIPYIISVYIQWGVNYIKFGLTDNRTNKRILNYAIALSVFGIVRNIGIFKWLLPTSI